MPFGNLFPASGISASGMAAERLRMEVIANNIANANTTSPPGQEPFRRQQVIFQAALDEALGAGTASGLKGVEVAEVAPDQSELPKVYIPGHPHADADGYVTMPNVKLAMEMVDLMTAARAYEANVRAAQTFKTMNEQALAILRS
jgi:flagellar basal-body rod protein FlgC